MPSSKGAAIRSTTRTRADALIWVNPADPKGLGEALKKSPARWVQLPFAGIESFFEAKVIDPRLTWTCAKGVYGPATAEHALALVLAACAMPHGPRRAHDRGAARGGGFGAPERRLKDSTVVIVGTGGIGQALVPMLQPLGARVLAVNRSGKPLPRGRDNRDHRAASLSPRAGGLRRAGGRADGRDPGTLRRTDARVHEARTCGCQRRPRGPGRHRRSGEGASEDRTIGGSRPGRDRPEPVPDDHLLWFLDNVLITPHVANTWDMALPELTAVVERNVRHFGRGRAPRRGSST